MSLDQLEFDKKKHKKHLGKVYFMESSERGDLVPMTVVKDPSNLNIFTPTKLISYLGFFIRAPHVLRRYQNKHMMIF